MGFYDTLPARATALVLGNYLYEPVSPENALDILEDIENAVEEEYGEINHLLFHVWDDTPLREILKLIHLDINVFEKELDYVYKMAKQDR